MTDHHIVPHQQWISARTRLLAKEKEFLRLRDQLSSERRELPWERVEKSYVFHGRAGDLALADLFAGRRQLIVYHFMFAPEWDAGCRGCSFWADNYDGQIPHLQQRDVSLVAVSRAPYAKLQAFQTRMGWTFEWVSSAGSDFNYAPLTQSNSDMPGFSVFYKDDNGDIFHTYSTFARGLDPMNVTFQLLDLVPKGRDEQGLSHPMAWVKLRDQYATP